MKLWTWNKLKKEFRKHPQQLEAYQNLPTSYISFHLWLTVDELKCDIVTTVINCKCAKSLNEQQQETMAYRRTVCSTAREWLTRCTNNPKYAGPIRRITKRCARKRKCHRNWEGPRAGIRCYCDEHNH